MESFPEMTNKVTASVRATGIEDPGRMSGGAGRERPDPEVPERARRRTFTAKYKLEILAAYDAAPDGEKGALLRREGLYSSHIWRGGGPVTPPHWLGWRFRAGVGGASRKSSRSPALNRRNDNWSRSWPRLASWWKSRQNCTRSWRHCPRARSPRTGR